MQKSYLTKKIKYISAVCILLAFTLRPFVVQAESLNGYETEVVSAAQGIFELNGTKYQVDPVFVQQLINYLNQDGVDLTATEKDEVIGKMFSNVERGVAEGYLLPMEETQDDTSDTETDTGNSTEDGDDESGLPQEEPQTSGEEAPKDTAAGTKEEEDDSNGVILDEIRKQPATITEVDQNKNKVTVKDEKNDDIVVVNTVIKNTGYNLNTAFAIGMGLFLVLVLSVVITMKCGFFRQEEQRP